MTPLPTPKKTNAFGVLANAGAITLLILTIFIVFTMTQIIVYHIHYPPFTWLRRMIESDTEGGYQSELVFYIVLFAICIVLYLIWLVIFRFVVPLLPPLNRKVASIQYILNKLNPDVTPVVISFALLYSIFSLFTYMLIIKPSVNSNVSDIISRQEESIGIKHIGKPNILLKFLPREFDFSTFSRATYNPKNDEIKIYLLSWLWDPVPYDELVGHELGHFYIKKRMEGVGFYQLLRKLVRPYSIGNLAACRRAIVNEGVSEYFRLKTVDDRVIIAGTIHAEIRTECPSLDMSIGYIEAYQVVKSIIDAHGESAIDYMLLYPPTRFDQESVASYQEQALRELKELE